MFYSRDASNHPGDAQISATTALGQQARGPAGTKSENWLYYWNQTGAGSSQAYFYDGMATRVIGGIAPGMVFWPQRTHIRVKSKYHDSPWILD